MNSFPGGVNIGTLFLYTFSHFFFQRTMIKSDQKLILSLDKGFLANPWSPTKPWLHRSYTRNFWHFANTEFWYIYTIRDVSPKKPVYLQIYVQRLFRATIPSCQPTNFCQETDQIYGIYGLFCQRVQGFHPPAWRQSLGQTAINIESQHAQNMPHNSKCENLQQKDMKI